MKTEFTLLRRAGGLLVGLNEILTMGINVSITNKQKAILISGVPRGGTTWLAEILLTLSRYRLIDEPLAYWYIKSIKINRKLGFNIPIPIPYIYAYQSNYELKEYYTRIFKNKQLSLHPLPLHRNQELKAILDTMISIGSPLVKNTGGNALLPWLARNFELNGIFMIIRHPCAVIESQLATGVGVPRFSLRESKKVIKYDVLKIKELKDKASKILHKIDRVSTVLEILAIIWSLNYYVALCYQKNNWWYTVVYEKLVLEGEKELRNIFGYLNHNIPEKALIILRKPSRTARLKKTPGNDYIGKWKKRLTKEDVKRILDIVNWFDLNFYDQNSEPDYKTLFTWTCK